MSINMPILGGSSLKQMDKVDEGLNHFPDDLEFTEVFQEAEAAIKNGIYPERIYQGSSGSYFVKNADGTRIIGVFKPKDEEPYGAMNPKWIKWCQRRLFPCCFGRNCLLPNQGYLSEAGAYIVDEFLSLGVVPKTKIANLTSETFNYSTIDKAKQRTKSSVSEKFPCVGRQFRRTGLPPKVGSFQFFVEGFEEANVWIRKNPIEELPECLQLGFLNQFQRIVILDYIIRNTDRGYDNWLIKSIRESQNGDSWNRYLSSEIKFAAIDNGLAFPFKHPNEWRTYPYSWSWLPHSKTPFLSEITGHVLPLLSDSVSVENMISLLYPLFKSDKGFDRYAFERQMSVMRGQIWNLTVILETGKSPYELIQMPPRNIEKRVGGHFKFQATSGGFIEILQQLSR